MTDAKYTPGPWSRHHSNTGTVRGELGTEIWAENDTRQHEAGEIIATVHHLNGDAEANATLIAAVPELVAALQKAAFALESVGHLQGNRDILAYAEYARAALQKAGVTV
jgi:hypothetical protein